MFFCVSLLVAVSEGLWVINAEKRSQYLLLLLL